MPTSTLVRALGPAGPASDAADLTYTPAVLTDWDSDTDPGNADAALDQLAERVDDNEILVGAHADRHAESGADDLVDQNLHVSRLRVKDTDPTPVDDAILKVKDSVLAIRNSADSAYAPMAIGAPLLADHAPRRADLVSYIATHAALPNAHHAKYTDSEARAAVPFAIYIPFGSGDETFLP